VDQQNNNVVSSASPALGRYFSDHLSAQVARIEPIKPRMLNRIVGFRFGRNGTMRNLRFELSERNPARAEVPPCFGHRGFNIDGDTGFNALRELFRLLQMSRLPPAALFFQLGTSLPWLVRAIWWRLYEKRLLFPETPTLMAHMVIEQAPFRENRITLSPDHQDIFGIPLAQIE